MFYFVVYTFFTFLIQLAHKNEKYVLFCPYSNFTSRVKFWFYFKFWLIYLPVFNIVTAKRTKRSSWNSAWINIQGLTTYWRTLTKVCRLRRCCVNTLQPRSNVHWTTCQYVNFKPSGSGLDTVAPFNLLFRSLLSYYNQQLVLQCNLTVPLDNACHLDVPMTWIFLLQVVKKPKLSLHSSTFGFFSDTTAIANISHVYS